MQADFIVFTPNDATFSANTAGGRQKQSERFGKMAGLFARQCGARLRDVGDVTLNQ